MLFFSASLAFAPPAGELQPAAAKCCDGPCTAPGYEKYYSVDVPHGFCGETCIHPEAYPLFKVFEKNLTKADGPSPCKEQFDPSGTKYSVYNSTVTHGVGPLTIKLDLYGPAKKKTTWRHLRALEYQYTFDDYCTEFGKEYPQAEEKAQRAAIFAAQLQAIRTHNEATPEPSWRMGLSEHTDKTEAEWRALKGLNRAQRFAAAATAPAPVLGAARRGPIPNAMDWREKGVVTPVKNQARPPPPPVTTPCSP